jgi:peroxiredoxin (alkyl hydroperoxide reductase subunit C)
MAILVGKKAPGFSASAVINGGEIVKDFTLEQFKGKYVVLFFYPKDFTSVCNSEMEAFQEKLAAFKSRNTEVIGVSTDTEQSHLRWLQMEKSEGGIKGVTYPLVSDINKTIAFNYDCMAGDFNWNDDGEMMVTGTLIAYRGLFLINKEGLVKHQLINDIPLGRNIDEAIRMVDAVKFNEEHGEVCPANWTKEKEVLITSN